MEQIPADVSSFFEKNGITEFKIIEHNEWKGRYCFQFRHDGRDCFLKWNEKEPEYITHYESLCLEESLYHMLKSQEIVPEVFVINDYEDFFVSDYISNAMTLREKIKCLLAERDITEIERTVKETMLKWDRLVKILNSDVLHKAELKRCNNDLFLFYLNSLLCSGPMGTSSSFIQRKRNAVLRRAYKLINSKKMISRIDSAYPTGLPVVHGDFHANNVIEGNESIYIIDLENCRFGSPEVELAYFYAQISLLLSDKRELLDRFDMFIKEKMNVLEDKELFWEIYRVFYSAIKLNKRFY